MKISQDLLHFLNDRYIFFFNDKNMNVLPENHPDATRLTIAWEKIGTGNEDVEYVGKEIALPKTKEVTPEWVLNKLGADTVYVNFAPTFEKYLKENGLYSFGNCYPTSYGIGVFVLFSMRGKTAEILKQVSETLQGLGIEYTNEYSDAMWVYRFKISKKKENIERMEKFVENNC